MTNNETTCKANVSYDTITDDEYTSDASRGREITSFVDATEITIGLMKKYVDNTPN